MTQPTAPTSAGRFAGGLSRVRLTWRFLQEDPPPGYESARQTLEPRGPVSLDREVGHPCAVALPASRPNQGPRRDAGGDGPPPLGQEGSPARLRKLDDHLAGYVDDYAGLRVTGPTSVQVRLVRSAALGRRELQARFPEISIQFAPAWHSKASARRLRDQIVADLPGWRDRGVHIATLEIDKFGLVVLGVHDPASGEAPLLDRYSDTKVRVIQGDDAIPA